MCSAAWPRLASTQRFLSTWRTGQTKQHIGATQRARVEQHSPFQRAPATYIWLGGQATEEAESAVPPHHVGTGKQFGVIRIQKVAPVQSSHGGRHPLAGDALIAHQGLHQSGLALVYG